MAAKKSGVRACARCGKRLPRERLIYSRHTGRYYCGPRDMDACSVRVKKNARVREGDGVKVTAQLRAEAERYQADEAFRDSMPWSEPVPQLQRGTSVAA